EEEWEIEEKGGEGRSLQVWEQTGRCHSELLEEQQHQEGGSKLGGGLRFPHTTILWVTCQQDVLNERLDARVDDMIKKGLLQELKGFHSSYNTKRLKDGEPPDYTRGIFQSIGFKEFHEFLILPEEEKETDKGRKLYEAGVQSMKLVPPVYTVDGTDPSQWNKRVRDPAQSIIQAFIDGTQPDQETANIPEDSKTPADVNRNDKTRYECTVCNRVIIGERIWKAHLGGGKHRRMLKKQQRLASEKTQVSLCAPTVETKT
ncbi:tRNA dimethylallyltransferase-like, partial [Homarus americanus]